MAGLKLLFAAGVLSAIAWRLAVPASAWRVACYGVAGAAMAAGPVLIWDMAHVGLGALLLHGGLLAGVLLLWRDEAVGARLGAMVERRRAMLRARLDQPGQS
jgi:phosphate/sulfate permease